MTGPPDPAGRVRGLRLRLGLTQEELARRVGVSFVTVNRWESGRSRPSTAALHQLDLIVAAPTFLTSFVGRARELGQLTGSSARLITVTGPAGLGKTRLAAALAEGFGSVAQLAVDDAPVSAGLVIVDLAGSPGTQALPLVRTLLGQPGRIVVTGRQALGLPGELVHPLAPLTPADSADLIAARCARTLDPSEIAALVTASGGIPSAIEALAAWTGSLTVDQVLDRAGVLLDEALAPNAAGLTLLDQADQECLRMLGIFAGAFTVPDAAAVTGITDDLQLVRSLRTLVEAGWLAVDPSLGSYQIALPWRRPLLRAAAEPALPERHARHVLAVATAIAGQLTAAGPTRRRLEAAADDLDQALRWAADHGADAAGLQASSALWQWWLSTGRISEGRAWIDTFLSRTPSTDESLLAQGWVAASVLAAESGEHTEAIALASKGSRAAQSLHQPSQTAIAEGVLGSANRYLGRRQQARLHFERALALREELGDRRGIATSLNNLALLALDDGDLARARQLLDHSLAAKRLLREPRSVAIGLCNLAHTLLKLDLVADALTALVEAAGIADGLGDAQLTGTVAANLGDAHLASGAYSEAWQDFQRAAASYDGHPHDQIVALCGQARALDGLSRRDEALEVLRSAEALASRTGSEHRMSEVRATLAQLQGVALSPPPGSLTPRQAEVLACLADGGSNREIAERLHLSAGTVERHLATAYAKLGLRNRVEAARYALQHGLLPPT